MMAIPQTPKRLEQWWQGWHPTRLAESRLGRKELVGWRGRLSCCPFIARERVSEAKQGSSSAIREAFGSVGQFCISEPLAKPNPQRVARPFMAEKEREGGQQKQFFVRCKAVPIRQFEGFLEERTYWDFAYVLALLGIDTPESSEETILKRYVKRHIIFCPDLTHFERCGEGKAVFRAGYGVPVLRHHVVEPIGSYHLVHAFRILQTLRDPWILRVSVEET